MSLREELQRKQQRWMAERERELDRKEAQEVLGTKVDDHRLLDRVTCQIAERMQVEMRLQNARALQDGAVGDRVERLLERHLEAHTCGICLELMSGKERRPTLLFPCGHTFCAACLHRLLEQTDRRSCPHCRQKIASQAPNVSLQQVIDAYVERQRSMEQDRVLPEILQGADAAARGDSLRTGGGGDGGCDAGTEGTRFAVEYQTLTMRCRVLEQELRETHAQLQSVCERRATATIVLQHLQDEETAAAARLEAARLEHELVCGQVAEQRAKVEQVNGEEAELKKQADLVAGTLQPLVAEREKLRLLAQAGAFLQ